MILLLYYTILYYTIVYYTISPLVVMNHKKPVLYDICIFHLEKIFPTVMKVMRFEHYREA